MDGWMIDDRLFTSGFLPRDLGLGETVGFALDASVGALSECLVGGFQDPAGWYWIQNNQVIRNILPCQPCGAVNPGVSRFSS